MSRYIATVALVVALAAPMPAGTRKRPNQSLEEYLRRIHTASPVAPEAATAGSLWTPDAALASIVADVKARSVGDTVVIRIMEETFAQATGAVATKRDYNANSGIASLPGKLNTSGVDPLLDIHSNEKLQGSGQASSHSQLRSSIAGRIVAVLPGNAVVIEASRTIAMNNERQLVTLRGVARAVDITPENSVLSTRLSDLEIEVEGRGIISDSTRRPHWLVRLLTRFLTF